MKSLMKSFGEVNFGHAQLGDARRTKRLVQTADLMCRRPGGTLPQKLRSPKDLRAFYRLMNGDDVTHEAILAAHRETVRKAISQITDTVLVVHDATEFDFTKHQQFPSACESVENGVFFGERFVEDSGAKLSWST